MTKRSLWDRVFGNPYKREQDSKYLIDVELSALNALAQANVTITEALQEILDRLEALTIRLESLEPIEPVEITQLQPLPPIEEVMLAEVPVDPTWHPEPEPTPEPVLQHGRPNVGCFCTMQPIQPHKPHFYTLAPVEDAQELETIYDMVAVSGDRIRVPREVMEAWDGWVEAEVEDPA